jgi:molybdate transport system regulatory protein
MRKYFVDNMLFIAYRRIGFLFKEAFMEIKAKFWIENRGEVVLGGGKTALLLAIDRLGSIQRAADEFGMSYRHAWGVIKKIENRAGFKIVETKLGGKDGGGAQLTPRGKAFVGKTDSFFKDLQKKVEKRFKQKFQKGSLG